MTSCPEPSANFSKQRCDSRRLVRLLRRPRSTSRFCSRASNPSQNEASLELLSGVRIRCSRDSVQTNTCNFRFGKFDCPMNPRMAPGPLRAYRRDGKVVIEIDEHRFCADAFLQSESRILDRDAFLAFA